MQTRPNLIEYEQLKAFAQQSLKEDHKKIGDQAFPVWVKKLEISSQQELKLGHHDLARDFLKIIIELCLEPENQPKKNKKVIASALSSLLAVFGAQKEMNPQETQALFQHYQQAFVKVYKTKMNLPILFSHYALAEMAMRSESYDEAEFHYKTIATENNSKPGVSMKPTDLADVYNNLGVLLLKKKESLAAQEYFQKTCLLLEKLVPENDEKLQLARRNLKVTTALELNEQKGFGLHRKSKNKDINLLNGDLPLNIEHYITIPDCNLKIHTLNNQIVFSIKGSKKNLNTLEKILHGPHGLLNIMNLSSQSGLWSLKDLLPDHNIAALPKDEIHLYYCDKFIFETFKSNANEEFSTRQKTVSDTFYQQHTDIWYTALVELSGYVHLFLASQMKNFVHGNIQTLPLPKYDDFYFRFDNHELKYIIKTGLPISTLEKHLNPLIERIKTISHLASQLENEAPEKIMKNVLFQAFANKESLYRLSIEEWKTVSSYLQLHNLHKAYFARQELLLQEKKKNRLMEEIAAEDEKNYQHLQESRLALLNGQSGPLIISEENYPDVEKRGWPFSRDDEKIRRLHGPWNNRDTLNDETMFSEEQNRFDFAGVLKKHMIVMDFGLGNGLFLKKLDEKFSHLSLYLVGIGIDCAIQEYTAALNELYYMPLPDASKVEAFAERFKGIVGAIFCTFGATTYAKEPHKVIALAAYLLRRGGHFSAIISSQPGHYDGTPIGYTEDRKRLIAFFEKYGMKATFTWTNIQSEVVAGAKPIDCKFDLVRAPDAPDMTLSLSELFEMVDKEIGKPIKLKAPEGHPYQFKNISIEANTYDASENAQNHIEDLAHIKNVELGILPAKAVGIAYQINLTFDSIESLKTTFQKLNDHLIQTVKEQFLRSWKIEEDFTKKNLVISYIDPSSMHHAIEGQDADYLSYLSNSQTQVRDTWIYMVETLLFHGLSIPGVTEKIDSFPYYTFSVPVPPPQRAFALPRFPSFEYIDMVRDATPYPHPETDEPIFTYRLIGQNEYEPKVTLGSLSLYGQSSLCRSPQGDMNNILHRDGFFEQAQIHTPSIPEICSGLPLPPTFMDKLTNAAKEGFFNGAFRGFANVLSKATSRLIGESFYYMTYFSYRYLDKTYTASPDEDAVYPAFLETLNLFSAHLIMHGTQELTKIASKQAASHELPFVSKVLDRIDQSLGFTLFACNVKSQGFAPSVASVAAGAATQTIVEKALSRK